ncbi:phage major capsid protein [Enterobacter kobei]|uniref:phage major capsid protein n=1 Tax=Enterobacter kobei TaxID=208224 RepID=UPI0020225C33|nr:phage major capsid protein [Enterobacter kobei]MCL8167121.1 phage major capsid protein [Enterobacter kobei]MCM7795617.1 phage major capsid protein [Enterobacter kobei]
MILRRNVPVTARDLKVETDEAGEETLLVKFSSEYPVNREVFDENGEPAVYGEVLLHESTDNADLSRLNDGVASLLFNHNHDNHLGIIVPGSAFIDVDKKAGYARVKFSKIGNLAQEIFAKVKEGTISNISFGYDLDSYSFDDANRQVLVDQWSVNEISFVTVPADPTVGLIRSKNGSLNIFTRGEKSPEQIKQEIANMPKRQTEEEIEKPETAEEEIQEVEAEVESEIETEEEEREEVDQQVEEAVDIAAVAEAVMEIIEERGKRSAINKGRRSMTVKKDTIQNLEKKFDLMAGIRARIEGKELKGAEAEYHQEQERKLAGKSRGANPLHIPTSALRAAPTYAQNTTSVNELRVDDMRMDSFVDMLLPQSVIGKLGVQTLAGLEDRSVLIPRQKSTAVESFGFIKEGDDVPGGKGSYDQIALTPKTFGGETVLNRRTILTTPGIQARISADLVKNSALALEKAMFGPTDMADAPKSLLTQIAALRSGSAAWNYKDMLNVIAQLTDAGVDESMIKFAMRGATKAEMMAILKDTGVSGYLIDDAGKLAGRDVFASGIFSGDEVLVGDFSGITIGEWAGLSLDVDPYTEARSGGVCLRVFSDMDWVFSGQDKSIFHLKKGTVTAK